MAKNKETEKNSPAIPDLTLELIVTIFGIFLLLLTFVLAITQSEPRDLSGLIEYFRTQRSLLILSYLGFIVTFLGLSFMIYSFYHSWKETVDKIYKKLK